MKAIVLAGGYATRMWPITKDRPKMLLPLGERTIIGHLFEELEADDRIDDFDDGEFGDWHETGNWRTTAEIAASGSHSAFTDTNRSVMTWAGDPGFERGQTLRFAFAFDDSSDQQFNCWFGGPNTDLGPCYRLDIHRDEIVLLDTDGWEWLGGDETYENETIERFHTAEIEFGVEGIRITVDGDLNGSVRFQDATYEGDVIHFDIETGGAYIDHVRISKDA